MAGKIVNADGTITYIENPKWPSRKSREPKAYPICGSDKKNGGTCGHPAGYRTPHLGVGHCCFHGGLQQVVGVRTLKNALTRNITYPGIQEEVKRLQEDRDVFDLREHIFLMEAIATTVLNQAKTMDDLGQVMKYVQMCAKVIQSLDEIEHGRRLVVELPEVRFILEQVKEVIYRHVSDTYTRGLIGRDLIEIPVGGARYNDRPDNQLPAAITGMAVEDGAGLGSED